MKTLGIDLGFYQVKLFSGEIESKFPSVIGYPSSVELANEEGLTVSYGSQMYYIGEKALRDTKNAQLTFTADKTDSYTDRIKYLAALGIASQNKEEVFHVVTGLPVDEYAGIGGLKEKLKANMEDLFEYEFSGAPLKTAVPVVTVIPQSAGAYYDYIMNEDGKICEDLVDPKTMVIDIGYRTTDIVTLLHAKYSPSESFTIQTGVSDIHKEMRKLLLKHHQIVKDISEIDEMVRNQSITIGGETISIDHLIEEATRPYAEKIISTIPLYVQNLKETSQILVTGGGANIMFRLFYEEFAHTIPIEQMEESEFSNARGYYKYSLFLNQNRR